VTTFSTISPNLMPSRVRWIFDLPIRGTASTGSKATLYPAFRNARVVVVGVEKPLGSRWMNSSMCARRAARKPDVRSGISRSVR